MEQLVARVRSLDAEAGAVLKAVTYFDKLNEGRVGLETLVRGAAVLSGSTAGLSEPDRHLNVRVVPDGTAIALLGQRELTWLTMPLLEDGSGVVWLETPARRAIDEVILERLVISVRAVLDRTRRRVVRDDAAAIEVLLNPAGTEAVRLESARRLGWGSSSVVRAIAVVPDVPSNCNTVVGGICAFLDPVELPAASSHPAASTHPEGRVGIGEPANVLEAWKSWEQARVALRFAVNGCRDDPGPRIVRYSDLGSLAMLAAAFDPTTPVPDDVMAIERAITEFPWFLETLHEVLQHSSIRAAARAAHVHHSTLQDRVARAEQLLGWSISAPYGRLRLQLALVARKLAHPTT